MVALTRRHLFFVLCTAIFAAGLGGGVWAYFNAEEKALAELLSNARRSAVAFQSGRLQLLTATRADLENPVYAMVKDRLVDLHRVQPGIHSLYLFRAQPLAGKVVYLADSNFSGTKESAQPGDEFSESALSTGLQTIIATGIAATEETRRDERGTWVTAYAPIKFSPAGSSSIAPPDFLGIDISEGVWNATLLSEAFHAAIYLWLLLGLPLAVQTILARWNLQERTIRRLSEAVEQSEAAVLVTKPDGIIEYVNIGLCEQTGYTPTDLIGRDWRDLWAGGTATDLVGRIAHAARAGTGWQGDWVNVKKSGERYPVHGVISPVRGRDGRVQFFMTWLQDMTETSRIESELRAGKDHAESGERAKGEFLDAMSHELRTSLNGIVGFTSLLLDTPLKAEQREYVQTVRSSGETLLRLTADILDYSRMETRPTPLEPQPCDVRVLLDEVLDLFAQAAAEKGIVLLHQVGTEVPALVEIDPVRLQQILTNLIGNAVKFTKTGEVDVRVRAHEKNDGETSECWLDFSVRDTGPGISPDEQAQLFKPFTQLESGISRRQSGSGLGLAISRSLVLLMGGDIALRSAVGNGAIFRFTVRARSLETREEPQVLAGRRIGVVIRTPGLLRELFRVIGEAGGVPIACRMDELAAGGFDLAVVDCDQNVVAMALEDAIDTHGWPSGGVLGLVTNVQNADDRRQLRRVFRSLLNKPLHQSALVATLAACLQPPEAISIQPVPRFDLRVLVVDDNELNLKLIQGIVTLLGCRSVAVTSGRQCLEELAREERFDLVLLDLHMPEMDGGEVLKRIRAGEAGEAARGVWITVVSADVQGPRSQLFELGCNDLLLKPVTLAHCISALQRHQPEGRP